MYLHDDLIAELAFVADMPPERLVFDPMPAWHTFQRDLKRSGIERVLAGRKVDFHALRVTFCTRLAKSGVSPQVAKELMRHSDIKLTTNLYTDAGLLGVDGVIDLPSLVNPPQISPQKTANHPKNLNGVDPVDVVMMLSQMLGIQKETLSESLQTGSKKWRRGGDSNPRYPCGGTAV